LATKLTLLDAEGERVLPACYGDHYISLLPGEISDVSVAATESAFSPRYAYRHTRMECQRANNFSRTDHGTLKKR